MPRFGLIGLLLLSGCMGRTEFGSSRLEEAEHNFPPMIIGANTHAVHNGVALRSCPASGSIVEQKGGPSLRYLGASPTSPDLCRVRIGNDTVEGWYGLWLTIWPGAEAAYPALTRLIRGSTGRVEEFDVFMAPGHHYHDLIRNEGVEEISLLGTTHRALKLAHYREGFDGNAYRSVFTVWKDLASGLPIYATYQHISGTPEIDHLLVPTRIAPAQ